MNKIVQRLKLYRIATVMRYAAESWGSADFVAKKFHRNRIATWFDVVYWYLFYGFDFNDYCTFRFWEKGAAERKTYISFRRNDQLRFALSTPEVHLLFLRKDKFNVLFKKYIHRHWLTTDSATETEIRQFIKGHDGVIAKPLTEYGGHGIMKLSVEDSDNTQIISLLNRGGYLIEEKISNARPLQQLAPGSLNTIRIVTVIDRQKQLHIVAALLRMGNGKAFTDNYHDGGMACAIDIPTGKLRGKAYGMNCVEYDVHPFSGITFDGYDVYGFEECMQLVKEIAFVEPSARYVGWDFAVTPNGIDLIEGNIPPGEDITQIYAQRGLWYELKSMI